MELFIVIAVVFVLFFIIRARNKAKHIQSLKDSAYYIQNNLSQSGYSLTKHGVLVAFSILEKGFSKYETFSWLAVLVSAQNMNKYQDITTQIQISKRCLSLAKNIKYLYDKNLLREDVFTNDTSALRGILSIDENTDAWVERILSFDPYANENMVAELISIYDEGF